MQNDKLVYGIHAVKALVRYDSASVEIAWLDKARRDEPFMELLRLIEKKAIPVERVSRQQLDTMMGDRVHQGVLVRTKQGDAPKGDNELLHWLELQNMDSLLLLILDGVQDPHNLGAILRTVDAAGCNAVIAPKDRATGLTPVVHKVSSGASQVVPFFQVTNLARTLDALKERGVWIVGAAGEATQVFYQIDYTGAIGIVMGAEGDGLRKLTREKCDYLVKIPMLGVVDSLNVSVATGVLLFEAVRQRSAKQCIS